jgi:multiple sugar transport system permease protein
MSRLRRIEIAWGSFFIAPWIIGFLLFTLVPMAASLYLSFTDYSPTRNNNRPVWVGLDNYEKMFGLQLRRLSDAEPTSSEALSRGYGEVSVISDSLVIGARDPLLWKSLNVTIKFAIMSLSVGLLFSLFLALLANHKVRGIGVFRALVYLPSLVPVVASAIVINQMFNREMGWYTAVIKALGFPVPDFDGDPSLVLLGLVLIGLWSSGSAMIMYLAGFQGIPTELYEAAKVDGANATDRFIKITLPMISPIIFYNLITGLIWTFQYYATAYVLTGGLGGPNYSRYFFNLHLTRNAFVYQDMGYASAMAWFLFAIVLVVTIIIFRTSKTWVFYPGGR